MSFTISDIITWKNLTRKVSSKLFPRSILRGYAVMSVLSLEINNDYNTFKWFLLLVFFAGTIHAYNTQWKVISPKTSVVCLKYFSVEKETIAVWIPVNTCSFVSVCARWCQNIFHATYKMILYFSFCRSCLFWFRKSSHTI